MSEEPFRQRLAAILVADAVRYSRLMAAGARATVSALAAARAVFRRQVETNQGRIIDIAGDSVLAVFETATSAASSAIDIPGRGAPAQPRLLDRLAADDRRLSTRR